MVSLASVPEPPEIRPSATAVAGGDDGWGRIGALPPSLLNAWDAVAASAAAGGAGAGAGAAAAAGSAGPAAGLLGSYLVGNPRVVPMVNVNNRLVPEDTVLNDGDLVILTREKVKI